MSRIRMTRTRWAVLAVAAWGVVLLALAVWSVRSGPETVREHSDLAAGQQTLDRVVETLRAEAGPGVTVDVEPYQVNIGCRITLARQGTEVDQVVAMTVDPGDEAQLLERLAQRAPPEWGARFNPGTGRFWADAGDFVQVVGEPAEPGEVRLTVTTGCRPD